MGFWDWYSIIFIVVGGIASIFGIGLIIQTEWDLHHPADPDEEWRKFKQSTNYDKWLDELIEHDIHQNTKCHVEINKSKERSDKKWIGKQ